MERALLWTECYKSGKGNWNHADWMMLCQGVDSEFGRQDCIHLEVHWGSAEMDFECNVTIQWPLHLDCG